MRRAWEEVANQSTSSPSIDKPSNNGSEYAAYPAVIAIASAPQKATRAVARSTLAPPRRAPTAPSAARKTNEARKTAGINALCGKMKTTSKGSAAPAAKVAAEVSAACTGRAVLISEIPSSSRKCVAKHPLTSAALRPGLRDPHPGRVSHIFL